MYMHLHICLRKRSHYDATVFKPDRNQLVYSKMGISTFTGVSGCLVVRASDSEVGGSILTSGRHEHCVLEQDILLVPSRHD